MNGHKILIVDDDAVILKALSTKLTANGFAVFTAQDGSSALAAMRQAEMDLMILDLSFPPSLGVAWDGLNLMNWIRQISNARVPVIIITATDDLDIKTEAMAAGAAGVFQKPIGSDQLLSIIAKTLKKSLPAEAVPS